MALLRLLLGGLVAAAPAAAAPPAPAPDDGGRRHVTVIDGDTLLVNGRLIHLYGIDCPERDQICIRDGRPWHCGLSAMQELEKIFSLNRDQPLNCTPWVGVAGAATDAAFVCTMAHEDLGQTLLAGGYCVTVPGAFPDYQETERAARDAGMGIWGSSFEPPSQWRQRRGAAPAPR